MAGGDMSGGGGGMGGGGFNPYGGGGGMGGGFNPYGGGGMGFNPYGGGGMGFNPYGGGGGMGYGGGMGGFSPYGGMGFNPYGGGMGGFSPYGGGMSSFNPYGGGMGYQMQQPMQQPTQQQSPYSPFRNPYIMYDQTTEHGQYVNPQDGYLGGSLGVPSKYNYNQPRMGRMNPQNTYQNSYENSDFAQQTIGIPASWEMGRMTPAPAPSGGITSLQPQTPSPPQQAQPDVDTSTQQVNTSQQDTASQPSGTPGVDYLPQGPSTLDPGSMGGLLAFLGGSGWKQQASSYPGWYQSQYGNQAPGGPKAYWP